MTAMPITGEHLAFVYFTVMLTGVVWVPVTWLLLSVFTPKKLLNKYFKEPHFTQTETILMAQFPGSLMRTAIFAWLLIFPKLGRKKRKIKDVKDYMPRWYRVSLTVLTVGLSFAMAVMILVPLFLYVFFD